MSQLLSSGAEFKKEQMVVLVTSEELWLRAAMLLGNVS